MKKNAGSEMLYFAARHKYVVVLVAFFLLIGVVDENSIINRYEHRCEISDLKEQIAHYRNIYNHDTQRLRMIENNPRTIERIARERYFMKADNEDIYVFDNHSGNGDNAE